MNPRRGDLVTVAFKGPYTGKPRPALVVQSNDAAELSSVVVLVCPVTSDLTEGALLRVRVQPGSTNNLRQASVERAIVLKIGRVFFDGAAADLQARGDLWELF